MRLTQPQQATICQTVAHVIGPGARVWLFGSRRDDNARGGDLDLLVESDDLPSIMQRAHIKLTLESSLAMPVDIVAIKRGAPLSAFQRIALAGAISLGSA
ncbi:MAG: nucleotidyltransferase domain-containing protein [Sulfuricellaceae bacterium]